MQSQYYNENLFKCQEKEKDTKKDESKYHLVNETMLKLCSYSFEIISSVDLLWELESWILPRYNLVIITVFHKIDSVMETEIRGDVWNGLGIKIQSWKSAAGLRSSEVILMESGM